MLPMNSRVRLWTISELLPRRFVTCFALVLTSAPCSDTLLDIDIAPAEQLLGRFRWQNPIGKTMQNHEKKPGKALKTDENRVFQVPFELLSAIYKSLIPPTRPKAQLGSSDFTRFRRIRLQIFTLIEDINLR